MPILRERPSVPGERPPDDDRDDDARSNQRAVVPAEAADLLDGDPRAEQRHAETQDAPRGEVDAGFRLPLGGDGVERHAEQKRVEQRRSAPMIGDECRRDRDDDGEQEPRPVFVDAPVPTAPEAHRCCR